jgi:hypothetical protein
VKKRVTGINCRATGLAPAGAALGAGKAMHSCFKVARALQH